MDCLYRILKTITYGCILIHFLSHQTNVRQKSFAPLNYIDLIAYVHCNKTNKSDTECVATVCVTRKQHIYIFFLPSTFVYLFYSNQKFYLHLIFYEILLLFSPIHPNQGENRTGSPADAVKA